MARRFLVSGEQSTAFLVARLLSTVPLIAGCVALPIAPWRGVIALAVGALLIAVCESIAAFLRSRRRWIEVRDGSFVVTDRHGTREIRDDEVHSIAYSSVPQFRNGEPNGFTRKCTLWISKEPQPLQMQNRFQQDQVDPLADFLQRLVDLLHDGFDAALAAGHTIAGDNWRLSQAELSFRHNGRDHVLRLDEIQAVDPSGDTMAIWQKGQDEPVVGFPLTGRNVWLLRPLIQSRLKDVAAPHEPAQQGLGRVLFQHQAKRSTVVGLGVLSVLVVVGGITMMRVAGDSAYGFLGFISLLLGLTLLLLACNWAVARLRCHELGVCQKTMLGEKQLLYSEVSTFSFEAVRHYHHETGTYTGTHVDVKLVPLPGVKGRPIHYSTVIRNVNADLDRFRDSVARIVSARMARELVEAGRVEWTINLTLRPDGIEYTPGGYIGVPHTHFLPFEKYGGCTLDQGFFWLFEHGEPKPVVSEYTGKANFYPGLFLLLELCHGQADLVPIA